MPDEKPQKKMKTTPKYGPRLQMQKRGKEPDPERCASNVTACLVLPEWRGVLAYDEFRQTVVLTGPPPFMPEDAEAKRDSDEWCDTDTTKLQRALAIHYRLFVTETMVESAVRDFAMRTRLHPVQRWFERIRWDRKERLRRLFIDYFGAEDNGYNTGVAECWMVSAVARTFEPGCQADYLVVLKGAQGSGKTKALRALFSPEWFSETALDLESKDAILALRGKVCVCFDELDSVKGKARTERVKNFLTRTFDSVRLPYARRTADVPRRLIFAGTTNEDGFLVDATGNRRFWPIDTGHIDVARLRRDRTQLWAEAVQMYRDGVHWWPSEGLSILAGQAQNKSIQTHVWEEPIAKWLYAHREQLQLIGVANMRILTEVLGKPVSQCAAQDTRGVALVMRRLGWAQRQVRDGKAREWRHFPTDAVWADWAAPDDECHMTQNRVTTAVTLSNRKKN